MGRTYDPLQEQFTVFKAPELLLEFQVLEHLVPEAFKVILRNARSPPSAGNWQAIH